MTSATAHPRMRLESAGLYCPAGDFYIDPGKTVPTAVITHAHGDHTRGGCGQYFGTIESDLLLRWRLGHNAQITNLDWGQAQQIGDVRVSLHPAGHILGSAQVRIEWPDGEVWVVTGDFKRGADPTCTPFEVVRCDTLVTEVTFGEPEFCWPDSDQVIDEIDQWWARNRERNVTSMLFCYALGKAQRILAGLYPRMDHNQPEFIGLHRAMREPIKHYRKAGVVMAPTQALRRLHDDRLGQALILAPPSARRSPWMRRFTSVSTGFASGWMLIPGRRERSGYDEGFVLSDHADWPELLQTVKDSGARRVLATHGKSATLIAHLTAQGITAVDLKDFE